MEAILRKAGRTIQQILRQDLFRIHAPQYEKKSSEEILKSLTVLYVNYNESKIDKQIHILSDFIKNIYFSKNGKDAIQLYKEKLPDIIVTDTMLPIISGFKLSF